MGVEAPLNVCSQQDVCLPHPRACLPYTPADTEHTLSPVHRANVGRGTPSCRGIPGSTLQGFPQLEILPVSEALLTLDHRSLFPVCIQSTYVCKACWGHCGTQRQGRTDSRMPGSSGYRLAEPPGLDLFQRARAEWGSSQHPREDHVLKGVRCSVCIHVRLSERS